MSTRRSPGYLSRCAGASAVVQQGDVALSQTEVRLQSDARMVWRPVWGDDDALARDVLDRRLVDTSGVPVVLAADASVLNGPQGWELAGIDVGMLSLGRRLITCRSACPPANRIIDWAQLQAVVPRFRTQPCPGRSAPTISGR